MRRVAEPSACVGLSVFPDRPQLVEALACAAQLDARSNGSDRHGCLFKALAKALGDELGDCAGRNFKGFTDAQRHKARSSYSEQGDTDVADGADVGSTMRRRHWLYRQSWTDFRAVFDGHLWRDAKHGSILWKIARLFEEKCAFIAYSLVLLLENFFRCGFLGALRGVGGRPSR